jgi:hypothetical protein
MIRTFINMLTQRERDRVRPDLLPHGEAELREACKARKSRRVVYAEVQR